MEKILILWQEKKWQCGVALLGIISLLFLTLYITTATAKEAYTCPAKNTDVVMKENTEETYMVDIKGAIVNPGVYKVNMNLIVNDVIHLAGGLTNNADTSNLNLSKKVSDEMVITVYTKDEVKSISKKDSVEETTKSTSSSSSSTRVPTSKVSLNNASIEELETIPGIGTEKAASIIAYRTNCKKFTSIEEIKNIKGIGDAVYAKLKDYITI